MNNQIKCLIQFLIVFQFMGMDKDMEEFLIRRVAL